VSEQRDNSDTRVLKSGELELNKGEKPMKRDFFQRRAYAARRLSVAVDRGILATSPADREQARRWVEAWRVVSGIRKPAQAPASATTDRKLRLVSQ
jgi:hypothetical protein